MESNIFTYSISLLFDEISTKNINTLINQISTITKNFYKIDKNIPPHITLGMFKVPIEQQDNLKKIITEINSTFISGIPTNNKKINLTKLDFFKNKILFLTISSNNTQKKLSQEILFSLNEQLHNKLLPFYKSACNNFYIPKNFHPHCTLATGLSTFQINQIQKNQNQLIIPKTITLNKISLAIQKPYKKIF